MGDVQIRAEKASVFAHIYELNGTAYDYAHYLIECLKSNEEHSGTGGTYKTWKGQENAIFDDFFAQNFEGDLNDIDDEDLPKIRDGVLAALDQLIAEEVPDKIDCDRSDVMWTLAENDAAEARAWFKERGLDQDVYPYTLPANEERPA